MGLQRTKLVVGRGRLFFDPFKDGTRETTGEQYLGNTPAFNITRSLETASRMRSIGGRKIKSAPVIVSESFTASFTTDNISYFNVANWFGADANERLLYGSSLVLELVASYGRIYDVSDFLVGDSSSNRIIDLRVETQYGVISTERNFVTSEFNYGRFSMRPDAPDLFDGESFTVVVTLQERRIVDIIQKDVPVFGALRYLSHNIAGDDVEYHYPVVMLTCSGSIDLKSDDFQQLSFNVEVFKLSYNIPFQFLKILPALTRDEKAILDSLATILEFPALEEKLNKLVQKDIPEDIVLWPFHNWIIPGLTPGQLEQSAGDLGFERLVQRDIPRVVNVDVSTWLSPIDTEHDYTNTSAFLDQVVQEDLPKTVGPNVQNLS